MDLRWTDEQNRLRAQFEDFGKTEVAPRALALADQDQFDHQSWDKLALTEFWKLIVPEAYGGQGEHWWDFTAAFEGLISTAGDGGFVVSVAAQAAFIRAITAFGSPAQKDRLLPELLQGAITATAISEPHTGTAMPALKTIASPAESGYLLNGEKFNISHASTAKYAIVIGRQPDLGKRDLNIFLLDTEATGYSAGAPQRKSGLRTLPTGSMSFDNVAIGEANVLKGGLRSLVPMMSMARVMYGLVSTHLLRPVLESAWDFLAQRGPKGEGLLDHQFLQQKITDVQLHIEQHRWACYAALSQVLHQDSAMALTGSVVKLSGARSLTDRMRDLLTLLGSRGYLDGQASHLMHDALGMLWVGGTEEMHRINIFNQMKRQRTD